MKKMQPVRFMNRPEKVLVDPSILTDPVVGDAVKTVMNNPAYQREIAGGFEPNSVKFWTLLIGQ